MTRKRYVKLMMARGYDRNGAQLHASVAVTVYGSYERGFVAEPFSVPDFSFLKSAYDTMIEAMAEVLRKMMPALASCLRAAADFIDPEVPDA